MLNLKTFYKASLFAGFIILATTSLPAQTNITLSDGKFMYRLTVEQLPGFYYPKIDEPSPAQGQAKKLPEIRMAIGTVKSITIFRVKDTVHKQVIIPGKNETAWPWTDANKEEKFIIEDMNFDGNNDIRLLNSADSFSYYCWIYQPSTGQFVKDAILSNFVNPQFDQQQKLVYQNAGDLNDRKTQIYRYINGILTLIEEDEVNNNYNNKTAVITIKKLVNGKMQVVKKTENPLTN